MKKTLSELIDICTQNDEYFSLTHYSKQEGYANPNPWRAVRDVRYDLCAGGDTAEEAVERLLSKIDNKL